MNAIYIKANIAVSGGPTISLPMEIEAEAYEYLDFTVPANTADLKVELQPGAAMSLLSVTADWLGEALSFRVDTTADAVVLKLDQPLLLAGGAIAALGEDQPKILYFSNSTSDATAKDAKLTVLVARQAIA